jgi:hypothetical protein
MAHGRLMPLIQISRRDDFDADLGDDMLTFLRRNTNWEALSGARGDHGPALIDVPQAFLETLEQAIPDWRERYKVQPATRSGREHSN